MPRIEVVAAVFYRDGEVLACKRAPGKSAAGKWEFPGGKIDDGEAPERALIREIQEELGISISVGTLVDRTVTTVGDLDIDLACYLVSSGEIPTRSSDHDEMRWLPVPALSSLDWATPDLPAVAALELSASRPRCMAVKQRRPDAN